MVGAKVYHLYGGKPPYEKVDTSEEAADQIEEYTEVLREQVYGFLNRCEDGATDDEIEVALGGRHQTVSARRRELVLLGRIVWSGTKRKTRSGRRARVWMIRPEGWPPDTGEERYISSE